MPDNAPPMIMSGKVATAELVMPTKEPPKMTKARWCTLKKCSKAAPIKPTKQAATTTDRPYLCNKKVVTAPAIPPIININVCDMLKWLFNPYKSAD